MITWITSYSKCDQNIERKIRSAKNAFQTSKKIWTIRKLSVSWKNLDCYVYPLIEGSECWTTTKTITANGNRLGFGELKNALDIANLSLLSDYPHKGPLVFYLAKAKRILLNSTAERRNSLISHLTIKKEVEHLLMTRKIWTKEQRKTKNNV